MIADMTPTVNKIVVIMGVFSIIIWPIIIYDTNDTQKSMAKIRAARFVKGLFQLYIIVFVVEVVARLRC